MPTSPSGDSGYTPSRKSPRPSRRSSSSSSQSRAINASAFSALLRNEGVTTGCRARGDQVYTATAWLSRYLPEAAFSSLTGA